MKLSAPSTCHSAGTISSIITLGLSGCIAYTISFLVSMFTKAKITLSCLYRILWNLLLRALIFPTFFFSNSSFPPNFIEFLATSSSF
jgi:hypothetical protein